MSVPSHALVRLAYEYDHGHRAHEREFAGITLDEAIAQAMRYAAD